MLTYYDKAGGLVCADVAWLEPADERRLLGSAAKRSRAALREEIARMLAKEDELNAALTAEQRAIGWGDCYTRVWPGAGPLDAPASTVYGYVVPLFEFITAEVAAMTRLGIDAAERTAEAQVTVDKVRRGVARGWWHVRAFSVNEPRGEVGDEHAALMTPISRAAFDAARDRHWHPQRLAGASR